MEKTDHDFWLSNQVNVKDGDDLEDIITFNVERVNIVMTERIVGGIENVMTTKEPPSYCFRGNGEMISDKGLRIIADTVKTMNEISDTYE